MNFFIQRQLQYSKRLLGIKFYICKTRPCSSRLDYNRPGGALDLRVLGKKS